MADRPILFSAPMIRALLEGRKTQTRRVLKPQPRYNDFMPPCMITPTVIDRHGEEQPGKPFFGISPWDGYWTQRLPYAPGDRLWVREGLRMDPAASPANVYLADGERVIWRTREQAVWLNEYANVKAPGIHMPRWASRLTLLVTDVRVQRLQDISETDALAEGCHAQPFPGPWWQGYRDVDGELMHQQTVGDTPPDWMIEPKPMKSMAYLDRSARDGFQVLWNSINGPGAWDENPWVAAISFEVVKANIEQVQHG